MGIVSRVIKALRKAERGTAADGRLDHPGAHRRGSRQQLPPEAAGIQPPSANGGAYSG